MVAFLEKNKLKKKTKTNRKEKWHKDGQPELRKLPWENHSKNFWDYLQSKWWPVSWSFENLVLKIKG